MSSLEENFTIMQKCFFFNYMALHPRKFDYNINR